MTRLKTIDIEDIGKSLKTYDRDLKCRTNFNLAEIAAMACGRMDYNHKYDYKHGNKYDHQYDYKYDHKHDHEHIYKTIRSFRICVVPVNSGLGIITNFSETVCAILNHMGFPASITAAADTSGVAEAFERNADAVMMADDHRFVGLNLHNRKVADNSEATGRAFATALGLMAKRHGGTGLGGKDALIMGCGPVGASAAATLRNAGARVALYDIRREAAEQLQRTLNDRVKQSLSSDSPVSAYSPVNVEKNIEDALLRHRHIVEATPVGDTISEAFVFPDTMLAAPGVPLGLTQKARLTISDNHLIHDKLELGVAVMAVSLLAF